VRTIACMVALVACTHSDKQAADSKPAPEPMTLTHTDDKQTETGYIGVLTPREMVEMTAPFTTKVKGFNVSLGDHVDVGQTLATLDDEELKQQIAVPKAELKGSQAEVAQAAVSSHAAYAAMQRERAGAKEGISSKADLQDATFKASEAGTGVAKAMANVEQEKAKIAQLESKLGQLTMTAPIAGRVSLRYVEPGGRIEEGRPVIRVISSDELFVKFAVPSEHVGQLAPGDKIQVTLDARGTKVGAVVKTIAPELDPVAQMIVAEAELSPPLPDHLQSGMVCHIQPAAPPKKP